MRLALALLVPFALLAPTMAHAAPPAAAAPTTPWIGSMHARYYALRLRPGQDLLGELQRFAREQRLRAAFVASCAGSLDRSSIRYANQPKATIREGHFEIVSLSGTLSSDGAHVHVSLADSTGATFGGHLMPGSQVYTTAEIVLGELGDVVFAREVDSTYNFHELLPRRRRPAEGWHR